MKLIIFVCNGDTIFFDLKRDQLFSALEDFEWKTYCLFIT